MGIKFLPISHFEKEGAKATTPIWGINTADKSLLEVTGEVLLAIPKRNGNGQPDPIRIPQTWLPIELTRDIPRARLLGSSEFRRAVNSNLISLISEDTAQRLLRQAGAKEEQARLDAQTKHVRTAGAARTIGDSSIASVSRADGTKDTDTDDKKVVIGSADDRRTVADLAAGGVDDIEEGITPSFKMWVDKLNTGTDMNAKNEIKARRSFKTKELEFLHRELSPNLVNARALVAKNLG